MFCTFIIAVLLVK